ncbi:MAG: ThuA domain-containing protein, partial [Rhodospirillales bacterium]|nr:ThuA domain-containing protein [Rhodospirillales bacterium]
MTIWNEFIHERERNDVRKLYPNGIHVALKGVLEQQLTGRVALHTATLDEPEHGLTDPVLAQTDVLLWWGHMAHEKVSDDVVDKVQRRVLEGMGLIVLHSAHYAKPFKRLMGTTCSLRWREVGEVERLWCVNPGHPIADGLSDEYIELPTTEMYGEYFDIPEPDELVFISWFEGGEVFRSGCIWTRGKGKVFYFRPGHETFPIYHDANVQRVIANGVQYVAPQSSAP